MAPGGSTRRHRTSGDATDLRSAPERADLAALFESIGIDRDYSGIDFDGLALDLQGWGSTRPVFERVLQETRPTVVIEVGTWKGASLLHMLKVARRLGCHTRFIAIDTWLGAAEHWLNPDYRSQLLLRDGYPSLFRQFVFNLRARDATEDVFAMPMTSVAAARVLEQLNVKAEAIYVDGSHDADDVAADLRNYWGRLREGGVMFGDDYQASKWPGVVEAVDAFASTHRVRKEIADGVWLLRHPA